ncbi:MAG: ligand-binding sensor domain-containing protein [Planctomycetota bacterium]
MGDAGRAAGGRWRRTAVAAVWVAAIAGAAAYIVSRLPSWDDAPPPPGWTVWRQPGSTRGLAVGEGGVYAGGTEGLFRLEADGSATPIGIPGAGRPLVHALLLLADGSLWVGHSEGLSVRIDGRWTTLTAADGLPHPWVVSLTASRDGWVWAGTVKGAAGLPASGPWDETTMRRMTKAEGLLGDTVLPILEDRSGGLWFGTYAAPRGGLSRLENGRWQHWTTRDGLPHANVAALMQSRDGRVWAGCGLRYRGGVAVFREGGERWELERTLSRGELAGAKVSSLFQDRQGRVWLGHEFEGLTVRDGHGTLRKETPRQGLPGREVMAFAQGHDGALWLGTDGGVARLSPEAVATVLMRGEDRSEETGR